MPSAVIQNSVQPLSHAQQVQQAQAAAAHVQAQAQAQAQAQSQSQAHVQALAQINAQSAFRSSLPVGPAGPSPAHPPSSYLGQQQQQQQQQHPQHQQQLPPSSSSQQPLTSTWPPSFPPPQQSFYEASSPGQRSQQLPEQHHLQGTAPSSLSQQPQHRLSHVGSISHSIHDGNALGVPQPPQQQQQQGNEHAHLQQQQRHSYGGYPSPGMPYGGGVGMSVSGPPTTMYPAAPPSMTVHQSPYAGVQPPPLYARASPLSSGGNHNHTYSPKQLSTRPPSIQGASPGPPAHQPYPTHGHQQQQQQQQQPPSHMSTPGPGQAPGLPISQQQQQLHQQQQQQPSPQQLQQQQPQTPGYLQHAQRPSMVGGLSQQTSASGGRLSVQSEALSPTSRERERERVSLLLLINAELLNELLRLQGEGKAGTAGQSPNQGPSPKASDAGDERDGGGEDGSASPTKLPTASHPDWVETLRHLQANLAYLAAVADRAHKPASTVPPSPAILTPPRNLPGLAELYGQLAALFPSGGNSFDGSSLPQQSTRSSAEMWT
ncbi:MAG: hypothetical protein M1823_005288 [Watsoniomyces obsoletus]|nr:MAG: hypothetical protein M1823_005288 [Watsoniomyces obsoletus]